THEVPSDRALADGQFYSARVFALNEIGYSLPQISATSQKPYVVPGTPTAVVLNFASLQSVYVTYLAAAPFTKTISGLATGVPVYVLVSAANGQGYGDTAASVPTSLNPYQPADAPTQVFLRATSDTILTVAFGAPVDDGGDAIISYRVQWDITPTFNGGVGAPNKDTVDLDALLYSSHTIQYLTKGQAYYVRVFAINSAGAATAALASPASPAPALQVPGKPHTITATTGTASAPHPRPRGKFLTTANTYTLLNLTPDRTYYIHVLARNAQGAGSYCAYAEQNCIIVSTQVAAKAKALASA
ncbi:fibronectin type III, partial [Ochromonadaceae sp. CCMP2298]